MLGQCSGLIASRTLVKARLDRATGASFAMSLATGAHKPPNVYVWANGDGDYLPRLQRVVSPRKYLAYEYTDVNTIPLAENTALFVCPWKLSTNEIVRKRVTDLFLDGGKIVAVEEPSVSEELEEVPVDAAVPGRAFKLTKKSGAVWVYCDSARMRDLSLSDWKKVIKHYFDMEVSNYDCPVDPLELTSATLFGDSEDICRFQDQLAGSNKLCTKKNGLVLDFSPSLSSDCKATECYLPVHDGRFSALSLFDWKAYRSELKTLHIGRLVMHCGRMTSTFAPLLNRSTDLLHHGLAVVADLQTEGIGRSGNKWISLRGGVYTSFQLDIGAKSALRSRLPVLQHLVGLAVVHAVRSVDHEYSNFDLRLKWPNDIYVGANCKVGGVVILNSATGSKLTCNIGLGVNLNNEYPTDCINDLLEQHNKSNGTCLVPLSREMFLARVFNALENFIETLEKGRGGWEEIVQLYYKYWLHTNQRIKIRRDEACDAEGNFHEVNGVIRSLDENGYLVVELTDSGEVMTVMPNGNSLDMMQGLIAPKRVK